MSISTDWYYGALATSIRKINASKHVNRPAALARHIGWQARKLLGLFPVTLNLSKSKITDDRPDGVIALVNALGIYDFNDMSLLADCTRGGGTFLDIGSNIGSYTLLVSENPKVRVLSFEPNPAAFRKLKFNVDQNSRTNVELHNIGLSEIDGTLSMTNDGSSSTNRIVSNGSILVPVQRLEPILESIKGPVVAKIDVEGHEIHVLKGAGSNLKRIGLIVLEEWSGREDLLANFLRDHGFQGPFYADAMTHRLLASKPNYSEDEVYISDESILRAAGWKLIT